MSKIEWTNKTWNPIVGCSKVSAGCKNCYAIRMAWRLQHIGHSAQKYAGTVEKTACGQLNWTGKINLSEKDLLKPLTWKKPRIIFVNSESDLFHESLPFEVIDKVFAVMGRCQHHTFQVLTKRPDRMLEYYKSDPYQRILNASYLINLPKSHSIGAGIDNPSVPGNLGWKHVWLGVSVENQQAANERIPLLLQVPAAVRFLSCEPLLAPINLGNWLETCPKSKRVDGNGHSWLFDGDDPYVKCYYCGEIRDALNGRTIGVSHTMPSDIHWVIVGGESGKDARPMHPLWVRQLRDQCQKVSISYFFKQWGEWVECGQEPGFIAGNEVRDVRNILPDGTEYKTGYIRAGDLACMKLVGKKKSGRQLDGREWNEVPGQKQVIADDPDLHVGGFD
jgi:protein gp37